MRPDVAVEIIQALLSQCLTIINCVSKDDHFDTYWPVKESIKQAMDAIENRSWP